MLLLAVEVPRVQVPPEGRYMNLFVEHRTTYFVAQLMTRYVERHTILCVLEEAHRMSRSDGPIRTWIRTSRRPRSDGCGIAQSVEAKRAKVVVEAQIVRIRAGIVIGWNVKGEVRLNPDACAIQCLGAEADDPAWLSSRQA